ncbi:hypothetical protein FB45DRAFT_1028840 [Roridomyces roridus]|uniref:F-box domain-containing protein n=1 Tax=Roridomyces roridus TaxID=1738132 RepID=A0AAD7FMW6_9AGAR|nr:hypothetical protein FB45DRAFT_1028840 [Roridomyces roridus]
MTPSLARQSSAIFAFWKKPQKPKISESDILLPTEIWLDILDLIPEIALDSISRASKRLRFVALPLFFRSQQIFPFQDTFAYRRISMSAHSELSPDGYQERSIQRLKFLGTTLISSAIRDFYVSPYPPGCKRPLGYVPPRDPLPAALLPLRALRELRIGAQLADGGASLEELFGAAREVIGTFPEGYDPTSWRRWVVDRPWSCVRWVSTGREEVSDVDAGLQEPVQGDLFVEYGEHYFKNFDRGSRISGRTLGILRLSS